MRKILFCIMLIFAFSLCASAYAFEIIPGISKNVYSNNRMEDTTELMLQLKQGNFYMFGSYEESYLRLMGQNVGDWRMLGVGVGYVHKLTPLLSMYLFPGIYFPNTVIVFDRGHLGGNYNEGIHRHLSYMYGEHLWKYYDVTTTTSAVGINVGLKWEKEIGNFLMGFSFGYRYLRIPINIRSGNTIECNSWHDLEIEDLSCASIGLTFGYRF